MFFSPTGRPSQVHRFPTQEPLNLEGNFGETSIWIGEIQ